jgi:AAA domain
MIFTKQTNTQAYLKAGLMGFAGSGKTYTATDLVIGLVHLLREKKLPEGNKPVFFLDTETGSDYVAGRFKENDIELFTAKTRAFSDLIPAVREAEANGAALIVDSISHFWREFTESYAKKKNRTRGLEFQDWAYLKTEWGKFTDTYLNSALHFVLCGRAGYEFDYFTNESGKKELEKTGIKMKAETDMGYEPSLLILMEREHDMKTNTVSRIAYVLKERFSVIDGKSFNNPTFKSFLPHVERLNLGGKQLGVDTSRTSEGMIPNSEGKPEWQYQREQCEIVLDQIKELLNKYWGGTSQEMKEKKAALLEKHLKTRSWVQIEKTYKLDQLKEGYNTLHNELEGAPAYNVPNEKLNAEQEAQLGAIQ